VHGGANSSEFRIPDSELEGSVELRVPSPQPSRLTPVPSDKILFPRRMLYVEAVLYATVAAAAFGLGYLAGRRGPSTAPKQDAENAGVQMRVPVEGRVLLDPHVGTKRGDAGAVVIILPADKLPGKRLPIAGLRPSEPPPAAGDATSGALAEFGGAAARADPAGDFALFVPAAGSYRILVLSRQATREPDGPLEQHDISDLERYFDAPADLLQRCRYRWLTKDIGRSTGLINVEFSE
jgi:hypothetical protein